MTFNPVIPVPQVRLGLEHYTWEFLYAEENAWAMAHVLNPFLIQMIFQNWWATALMFMVWESVEVAVLLRGSGGYGGLFIGDHSDYEPVADSLVGDPLNGVLGMMMAFLFVLAFRVPRWTPYLWGPAWRIWWLRLAKYLLMIVSLLAYNFQLEVSGFGRPLYIGIYVTAVLHILILWTFERYVDSRPLQMQLIWGGDTKSSRKHLHQIYLCWSLLLTFMHMGATYYVTYAYFQVWILWAISCTTLLLVLASQGRYNEVFYFLSLEHLKRSYYYRRNSSIDGGDGVLKTASGKVI